MRFITECITVFLFYVFDFDLIEWRIEKAEKWALKHTETITLKNGLKMLKAEKLFPFFYRIPLYFPGIRNGSSSDRAALWNIAEKDQDIIFICYFQHASRVDITTTKSGDLKADMNRVKSDRIIRFSQSKINAGFRMPVSDEELIFAAEQSCDSNETLNPMDAEMQSEDFNLSLFLENVWWKIQLLAMKFKRVLSGKKEIEEEIDPAEMKLIEESTRLLEIKDGQNLLVGENLILNRSLGKFAKEKNVRFLLERNQEERSAILMSLKSWDKEKDEKLDLRKLKSDTVIYTNGKVALLRMDMLSNTDVAEMLRKIIPEKAEGVGDSFSQ
ncbi:hypothetical protein J6253_09165 [bacterium]|nr:hypothetical protein [bacterium]